jgi:hypothetical protein
MIAAPLTDHQPRSPTQFSFRPRPHPELNSSSPIYLALSVSLPEQRHLSRFSLQVDLTSRTTSMAINAPLPCFLSSNPRQGDKMQQNQFPNSSPTWCNFCLDPWLISSSWLTFMHGAAGWHAARPPHLDNASSGSAYKGSGRGAAAVAHAWDRDSTTTVVWRCGDGVVAASIEERKRSGGGMGWCMRPMSQ